jgi:hypothetical protein
MRCQVAKADRLVPLNARIDLHQKSRWQGLQGLAKPQQQPLDRLLTLFIREIAFKRVVFHTLASALADANCALQHTCRRLRPATLRLRRH